MDGFKQLIDETDNIKNELIDCHTNLKNNLIDKGVKVTDSDKIPSLIDKINYVQTKTKLVASNNYLINPIRVNSSGSKYYYTVSPSNSTYEKFQEYTCFFTGSIRVEIATMYNMGSASGNIKLLHKRGDIVISEHETSLGEQGSYTYFSVDFDNIDIGDTIEVQAKRNGSNDYYLTSMALKGDIV